MADKSPKPASPVQDADATSAPATPIGLSIDLSEEPSPQNSPKVSDPISESCLDDLVSRFHLTLGQCILLVLKSEDLPLQPIQTILEHAVDNVKMAGGVDQASTLAQLVTDFMADASSLSQARASTDFDSVEVSPDIQRLQEDISSAEQKLQHIIAEKTVLTAEMTELDTKILTDHAEVDRAARMVSEAQRILDRARVHQAVDYNRMESLIDQHTLLFKQGLSERENLRALRARLAQLDQGYPRKNALKPFEDKVRSYFRR